MFIDQSPSDPSLINQNDQTQNSKKGTSSPGYSGVSDDMEIGTLLPTRTTSTSTCPLISRTEGVGIRHSLLTIFWFKRPRIPHLNIEQQQESAERSSIPTSKTPLLSTNEHHHRKRKCKTRRSILRDLSKCLIMIILSFVFAACAIFVVMKYDQIRGNRNGDTWVQHPLPGTNSSIWSGKVISANSHNDELQGSNALQLALSLGYGYIEIDTYLGPSSPTNYSSSSYTSSSTSSTQVTCSTPNPELDHSLTLLAGHDVKDLNPQRTLKKLYFDPLLDILDKRNADRGRGNSSLDNKAGKSWNGVYEGDPDKEVGILIDMKRDGDVIWPYLLEALQPFISKGYLTSYNVSSSTWSKGPLMIIGTGETPLSKVYHSTQRYIFYDAPLLDLDKPVRLPKTIDGLGVDFEWDNTISPIASSKLPLKYYLLSLFSSTFRSIENNGGGSSLECQLRSITSTARKQGIQSRWWGITRFPKFLKLRMWDIVWEAGQDILNTDDLLESRYWLDDRVNRTRSLDRCLT